MLMMKKLKRNKAEEEKGRRGEREKISLSRVFFFSSISAILLLNFGCQPNQEILKSAPPPPTPMSTVESKKTSFEEDLRDMQTANFDYIYAFRRKDGGVFDKDDKKYLRENTPLETNRFILTDEGKAFIAGSGFGFSPENMDALRNHFIVEDYSKPEIKKANEEANKDVNKEIKPSRNSNKANTNKANSDK
jgi:hypothetical protein